MKAAVFVAAALLLAAGVAADCPNACSGNGRCSAPLDYCQCYSGFMGNDCSQRVCPFGLAWIDSPTGDLNHDNVLSGGFGDRTAADRPAAVPASSALTPMWRPKGWWERHPSQLYGTVDDAPGSPAGAFMDMYVRAEEGHFYSECSSRGLCDRETGICSCFTGYEGAACNRTACPNDCSGHGVCESLRQNIPSASADYRLWDSDKSYGCVCDAEYTAADCSQRRCYKNNDPLTSVTSERGYSEMLSEQDEQQRIKIACANGGAVASGSTIKLTYTDVQFGETYTTGDLDVDGSDTAAEATAILNALRGLPNDVLASSDTYHKVKGVSAITTLGGNTIRDHHGNTYHYFVVTFDSSLGDVPLMTANTDGMNCKAGWVLPSDWSTNGWVDSPQIAYLGSDATMGPTVDMTLSLHYVDDGGGDAIDFSIALAGGVAVTADGKVNPTVGSAVAIQSGIPELLPMTFKFPGGFPKRGTKGSAVFKVEFKAGAPAVTIETPSFQTSSTLPITYAVLSNVATANDYMFIQLTNPNNIGSITAVSSATAATFVAGEAARNTYTFTTQSADAATSESDIPFPAAGEWITPSGTASTEGGTTLWTNAKISFALGAQATVPTWSVHEQFGRISDSDEAAAGNLEYLDMAWTGSDYPLGPVNIHVQWAFLTAEAAHASAFGRYATDNAVWYKYTYNGEEMGAFASDTSAHSLGEPNGNYGVPADANTFTIAFSGGIAPGSRTATSHFYFSTIMIPYQQSWGYVDTFTTFYNAQKDTSGVTNPESILYTPSASSNFGFVLNFVDTSGAADKYRWKLSTDEVWMTSGSNELTTGVATETGLFSHTFYLFDVGSNTKHSELTNFGFDLSLGVDNTNRACDDSTNAYLYIQTGLEGINDFNECSDRGLCNTETGECECFKGYKGTDCSIQSALAF